MLIIFWPLKTTFTKKMTEIFPIIVSKKKNIYNLIIMMKKGINRVVYER